MTIIAPDYYPEFRCIADKCRHSCCIGWEIDVDADKREEYRRVPDAFGARLNAAIDDSGETACFHLGENERCPMLNASGLCDLITELGEGALCQICADHPRFRNFFGQSEGGRWPRTELGLGLCCEEAARIILTRETPMKLIALEGDEETPLDEEDEALLAIRDTLLWTLREEDVSLPERLDEVLALGGLPIPQRNWAEVYRELERLDPAWDALLDSLEGAAPQPPAEFEPAYVRFCEYLLYRHLPGAAQDEDIPGRTAFCVLSTWMLMALCAAKPGCTMADVIEFARMYSAEVEYSDINIQMLLDALWEED